MKSPVKLIRYVAGGGSGSSVSGLPSDVSALAQAFSFTPPRYTDFRQAWDLHAAMEERPLFKSLSRLSGRNGR